MYKLAVYSLLVLLLTTNSLTFAQNPTLPEKPKLIDFGASLKPDYIKKNAQPNISKSPNNTSDENEIIKIDTDLVVTDVLVINEKGFAVTGLAKEDFIVTEDKKPQTIDTFSMGDGGTVPRSFVLIMDYSGSLLPFIKTSVAAAKILVDKLKPQDRMAIVTDDVELLTNFTRDKQLLKDKLDSLENNVLSNKLGKSQQYSALMATLNELFDEEDVRPIVIFQTDGDELGLLKGNFTPLLKPSTPPNRLSFPELKERVFSYKDVITAAEKARTTIYTIIPGTRYVNLPADQQLERAKRDLENRVKLNAERLNTPVPSEQSTEVIERMASSHIRRLTQMHSAIIALAKSSGGWAEHIEVPEQSGDVYSRVLWDLNNRYLIGYYPTNQKRDGKRRTVKIEIKNHPDYRIFARRYYFASEN